MSTPSSNISVTPTTLVTPVRKSAKQQSSASTTPVQPPPPTQPVKSDADMFKTSTSNALADDTSSLAVSHNASHAPPTTPNSYPSSTTHTSTNNSSNTPPTKQYVFMGGSCDPTTWRRDIAIPKFTKYNITYYNPQLSDWHPDLIAAEATAKEECSVLLFVIDSATRAIASMLEATEYIMRNRAVVLVILDLPENAIIDGMQIDSRQLKDLNRARAFLCDIASRHQKNCDVFDSIESAVNHIIWQHPSMSPYKQAKHAHVIDTSRSSGRNIQMQIVASPPPLSDNHGSGRPNSSK